MNQYEGEGTNAAQLAKTLGMASAEGVICSGGPLHHFAEGWAINGFHNKRAHYFKRNRFESAMARCGNVVPVNHLMAPGNWPKCSRCAQLTRKR